MAESCPYGERYAHELADLVPERSWDPRSKPRATEPCPLGLACPVHVEPRTYLDSGTVPRLRGDVHRGADQRV